VIDFGRGRLPGGEYEALTGGQPGCAAQVGGLIFAEQIAPVGPPDPPGLGPAQIFSHPANLRASTRRWRRFS
jgi:hypothetical protein